jgi:hypothetical protein
VALSSPGPDYRNFLSPEIYAQRVDDTGLPLWTADGKSIASFAGPLAFPSVSRAVPGPTNAAIFLINVLGVDVLTGSLTYALHAQKVNASGDPQWGASAPVRDVSSLCFHEQIVEDGSGGAYVAWTDGRNDVYDIYLQRLDPTTGSGLLTLNGKAVCDAAGWQDLGAITRDAGGNVTLIWTDERSGQSDIYVHRVDSSGNDVWDADGKVVCNLSRGQYFGVIAPWKSAVPERLYVGWTDNRAGDARYVHVQRLDSNGDPQWTPNGVTRTVLALVSAEASAQRVRLEWHASASVAATVYRRAADADWTAVGVAQSDGVGRIRFEDRDVVPGARYGYRLGIPEAGGETFEGEVWVEIPVGLGFAIEGLRPNPAMRDLIVSFALPSGAPARLELLDVTGRLVRARELVGLAPGHHTLRLDGPLPPAGLYFLRLTQSGRAQTARASIMN